jgi:hypothetical protein
MTAPNFTTEVYVESYTDVEITPKELEKAGWIYVGKGGSKPSGTVLDVVERWHYENHEGPWRFCEDPLCDELRGRPQKGGDR